VTDGNESPIISPIDSDIENNNEEIIVSEPEILDIEAELDDPDDSDESNDFLVKNSEVLLESKDSDHKDNPKPSLKSKLLHIKSLGRFSKKFNGKNAVLFSVILAISTFALFTFCAYKLYKSTKKHENIIWQSLYPENEKLASRTYTQDSVNSMV